MSKLKVGDKVTREIEGLVGGFNRYEGNVIEVTDDTITCTIMVDVPRTMRFSARTGINENGIDYGWLVELGNGKTIFKRKRRLAKYIDEKFRLAKRDDPDLIYEQWAEDFLDMFDF